MLQGGLIIVPDNYIGPSDRTYFSQMETLDPATGHVRWRQKIVPSQGIDGGIYSEPVVANGVVYISSSVFASMAQPQPQWILVEALDVRNGAVLWSKTLSGFPNAPFVDEEHVILLADNGLVLALDELVPYAHWITPEGMPKRFDTWFFLAAAPSDQLGAHDGRESIDSIWVSPREALAGGETGRFKLPFPTTRNLIKLGKQGNVQDALKDSTGKSIVTVTPVMTRLNGGRQLRIPKEAGYDGELFEVGALG